MSLDLNISTPPCELCRNIDEPQDFNYTYNVAQMWYTVFPDDDGMVQIEGMTGKEAEKKISIAIDQMMSKETVMKAFEPANGWGTYKGFLKFLLDIRSVCVRNPAGIWSADR